MAVRRLARWLASANATNLEVPNFWANSSGKGSWWSKTTFRPNALARSPTGKSVSGGLWRWITSAPRSSSRRPRAKSCAWATAYSTRKPTNPPEEAGSQ